MILLDLNAMRYAVAVSLRSPKETTADRWNVPIKK